MKSFILISLNNTPRSHTMQEIKSYPEVKRAHYIFGEWDMIAEVNFPNAEELASFVMDKLRSREDVKLTSCLIVAGE